jgi:hypothetical protein
MGELAAYPQWYPQLRIARRDCSALEGFGLDRGIERYYSADKERPPEGGQAIDVELTVTGDNTPRTC